MDTEVERSDDLLLEDMLIIDGDLGEPNMHVSIVYMSLLQSKWKTTTAVEEKVASLGLGV